MIKALQTTFNAPIGAALMTDLYARGVRMARLDVQGVSDPGMVETITREALVAGLRPLLIIRPDQTAWLPDAPMLDVEVCNEPDLTGISPEAYAVGVNAVYATVAGRHRIWAGSLSNLIPARLAWLARVLALVPPQVGVTVHRYPRKGYGPEAPQEGFRSRFAELSRLREVVGARPWGVSEIGYHGAPETRGWWLWRRRVQWTETQVAAFVRWEFDFWANAGAAFCVLYQLNDPPPSDPFTYGIRRTDGSWKPVSDTFKETS